MDDFDFGPEPTELSTSAMSLNFNASGRITHLWLSDTTTPIGADQQFVSGPIPMGDETSDEYLPGTILLGLRTDPDEPWLVSRNTSAEMQDGDNSLELTYDFPLIRELKVTGSYTELPDRPGVVAWNITIKNTSKQSIEIGELGFPFALLNSGDGFPISDEGMNALLTERLIVHKHIGGAGSYLAAKKMCGDPPGLLIFPGEDSPWEFTHSAPLSLRVSPGWPGVPIVYIHSQATVEREDWEEWFYGHSSIVLEPRESKTYQVLFAPLLHRHGFDLNLALIEYGIPCFRTSPGAVTPIDLPLTVEVAGTRPAQLSISDESSEIDSESDELGASCVVRADKPGDLKLLVEDMEGREAWAHFMITPPISDLIDARASYICENQVSREGIYRYGILPADNSTGVPYENAFDTPWGITSSLADATFLAEKNALCFDPGEVQILDEYIENFLLKRFHKPGQNTFGAMCPAWHESVAMDGSRAQLYVYAASFYLSVSKIKVGLSRSSEKYLALAEALVHGMGKFADREGYAAQALVGASHLWQLPAWREMRKDFLSRFRLPFWSGRLFSTQTIEEVGLHAIFDFNEIAMGSVEQLLLTHKSPAPNWWSYGNETRSFGDLEPHPNLADFGEISISPSGVANSQTMIHWLNRDYTRLDEFCVRMAFAGRFSPWAYVRSDGAASMGYCPDLGSSHRGISPSTGDIGFALAEYLRSATVFLLSTYDRGFVCYGGVFDSYPKEGKTMLRIEPKDGVGKRVVARQLNLIVTVSGAKISSLEFDLNLKELTVVLENPSNSLATEGELTVEGLWGEEIKVDEASPIEDQPNHFSFKIDPSRLKEINFSVK